KNQQVLTKYEQLTFKQQQHAEKIKKAESQLSEQEAQLENYLATFTKKQQTTVLLKERLALKEKQMYDAMGILQQGKARLKSLKDLQESYAGFYQGVRAILKAKDRLHGVVGAVAELLQVPNEV